MGPRQLQVVVKWLRAVGNFVLSATVLAVLLGLIVLATIPLGPNFTPIFVGVVPTASVLLAIIIEWKVAPASRRRFARRSGSARRQVSWHIMALVIVVMGVLLIVALTPTLLERSRRSDDADEALQNFVLVSDTTLEDAGLTRTLAELERARRTLEGAWPIGEASPIRLAVFRNREEYLSITRAPGWSDGGTRCLPEGPLIAVPSEKAEGILTETAPSATPHHEMVHAQMCQSLGWQSFYSIPRWFHEGLAQLYSKNGLRQFPDRTMNRIWVWFKRDQLMAPSSFCIYKAEGSLSEVQLFYATTWEFTRWLARQYGLEALEAAAQAVEPEKPLDEALATYYLGSSCQELYEAWRRSF